ncbi:MAG TPA: sterol desaturase family protein [Pyrinomonadaceae bacterium]|nr:sterol desaturase family protein [Pyrinomonadaceae bacterium]
MVKAWRQFAPLYFYSGVSVCLALLAARKGYSAAVVLTLLAAGCLSWGFIEYGLHRFIFHYKARSRFGRKLIYQAHLAHHEKPKARDRIFASLILSTPIAAAYWLLAWAATGAWAVASWLFVGMAAGYFCYEWLHFQCHHGRSRLRLLRYLRKYHLLHHYKTPELRFGVTSPLFDFVFRTYSPALKGDMR